MTCKENCKDCIHYECCCDWTSKEALECADEANCECKHFKPKSRFVELPCEVGQTVYVDSDTWEYDFLYFENRFIHSKYFLVGEIVSIIKTKKQLLMKIRVENSIHTRYKHKRYTVNAIGVTVFLSHEETENALKERVR